MQYSVGLPWKIGHDQLPAHYNVSMKRLNSQFRKLKQNPNILEKYNEIIKQQESDGIVEWVTELEQTERVHYLPHRALIQEDAETMKFRIIYDASSKDRKCTVSLNDCLHVGRALTPFIL